MINHIVFSRKKGHSDSSKIIKQLEDKVKLKTYFSTMLLNTQDKSGKSIQVVQFSRHFVKNTYNYSRKIYPQVGLGVISYT